MKAIWTGHCFINKAGTLEIQVPVRTHSGKHQISICCVLLAKCYATLYQFKKGKMLQLTGICTPSIQVTDAWTYIHNCCSNDPSWGVHNPGIWYHCPRLPQVNKINSKHALAVITGGMFSPCHL